MIAALGDAFQIILSWQMLLTLVIGTLIGMLTSIMPGIGGVTTIALLMVFTFSMEQHQAMAFLTTLMGAGGFAGSLTAILLNVPGDTQNAATLIDGYPLSQQGRAGEAIGASATASALGALFGVLVLVSTLPFIRSLVLAFGPPEMFALGLAGIALIGVISRGNTMRGLISGMAGMTLAFVGLSQALGGHRFTFGIPHLYDGIPLIPVVIGLFAIPEIYILLHKNQSVSGEHPLVSGSVTKGIVATLRRPLALLRGSVLGTLVGIVPGVGGSVAPWVAYSVAKAQSREPETFGRGNIEGVIAPESANDAKDGGALMPLFALGIPGSLSTALILSAFMFHGILPGQRMFDEHMSVVWVMLIALLFTNFVSSGFGLLFARTLIQITRVPITVLAPIVLGLSLVGSFTDVRSMLGILIALIVGAVGVAMVRADYPRPPFLVGFVLLPLVETNFHRSIQIYRGSYEFLLRPITLTVLAITVLMILAPVIGPAFRWLRVRVMQALGATKMAADARWRQLKTRGDDEADGPAADPIAALLVDSLVLISAGAFLWFALDLREDARLFPMIVMMPMLTLAGIMLATDFLAFSIPRPELNREWYAMRGARVAGWVILLPILILLVGMLPAIGIHTILLRLFFDRGDLVPRRILEAVAISAGTVLTIYFMFVVLLGVPLPNGLLI